MTYQVQDDIIQGALRTDTPGSLESPWVVFTAGAMVSGIDCADASYN